jgi:predicted Zn-dependent protease
MSVRGRWARIIVVAVLLLLGLAGWFIGVSLWSDRQYQAALEALERHDYEEADAHLGRYLSACPRDPLGRLLAAQLARRRGKFDEAERQLREARRCGAPAEAIALEQQLLRVQAGNLAGAGPLLRACADDPQSREAACVWEAVIEGSLKALDLPRAKETIDLWLRHRRGTSDQAQGLLWRGRVRELMQDFPQALADYRRAVELEPERAACRLRLAEALIRDEPQQAVEHLDWLRRRRPTDPEVLFQSARLCRSLGRPEEAGRLLDEVLAGAPDNVPALVERGRVAMDSSRPEEAEHWLRRALALAPEQREVNVALGDCLRQAGRLEEARRYQDRGQEIAARLKKALEEWARGGKSVGRLPERPTP